MPDIIKLIKKDEVNLYVDCEMGLLYEISEYFTFEIENARFHPIVRNKLWDGKIRLLNTQTREIGAGLKDAIIDFCNRRRYQCIIDPELEINENIPNNLGYMLSDHTKFQLRDYQNSAILEALQNKRKILISPTGSGKSFIIYLIIRYLQSLNKRILIIVHRTSLITQMMSDFQEYNNDNAIQMTSIRSPSDKQSKDQIIISTWQSIYKEKKEFFEKFDAIIGDEVHTFKAKSLTSIMTKLTNAQYRLGFTGTLDGSQTNEMALTGMFGPITKVTTTSELIETNVLAQIKINNLILTYPQEERKKIRKLKPDYHSEMDYIVTHEKRNKFIRNLAWSLKGNTLVLFQYVEKHGKPLYDLISDNKKNVYFVYGGVNTDIREEIRQEVINNSVDAIIIASYGTFQEGINIPNLHNIILASPSKSQIRVLQSIGRSIRKHESKEYAMIYDIVDNFSLGSWKNYAVQHFSERLKMYSKEKAFDIKINNVNF